MTFRQFFRGLFGASGPAKPRLAPPAAMAPAQPVALPVSRPRAPMPATEAAPAHRAAVPDTPAAATPRAGRHSRSVAPDAVTAGESGDAVNAFVASVRHLPLFSGTATRLMRSVGQENITARELSKVISTDAALVAHLLRIVNSPFFGFTRSIGTVPDALSVLGADQVRRTVMAAVLQRPPTDHLVDSRAIRGFWHHELVCASLARFLAFQRGCDVELAYMAGLMHDIGRLAMLMKYPAHAGVLLRIAHDDDEIGVDREVAIFRFDHAQAGSALLELWELPAQIVQAAREHVSVSEPDDPVSACVWRANLLAHTVTHEPDDLDVERPWMTEIGMTVKTRRKMLDEIRALQVDQR